MAYVGVSRGIRREASETERVLCVAAICMLALAPLAICFAITVWGS